METNSSNIRKEVSISPLNVTKVYKSDWQKEGTLSAEIKQTVVTKSFYPTKSVANSLNDNIFQMEDFGFEEKDFTNTETRVAWIDVPVDSTVESVRATLAKFPDATLYRVLSNRPILADTEQYAINSPELQVTIDTFANRQVVRLPEGSENPGALALINGKPQYRRIAFSRTAKEDLDLRTSDPVDVYMSPEIHAEINGVTHIAEGQSL